MRSRPLFVALAVVFASAWPTACKLDDPTAVSLGNLITLTIAADSIPADGVSPVELVAQLRDDTQDTATVTFRAGAGTFQGASAVKASANRASAILTSGLEVHTIIVSASVRDFQAVDSVRFYSAAPDRLTLSTNRTSAPADGTTAATLTVELKRPAGRGKVSVGTEVLLIGVDSLGQEIRALRRTGGSDEQGQIVLTATSLTVGRVTFIARATGLSGEVADTVTVSYK